jgi:hypothetical protein
VWAQHSDHRIPLQKIIQVSLLRLGGIDFSFLILTNTILIFLKTSILISMAAALARALAAQAAAVVQTTAFRRRAL